jgi:hopanoid biosynthesis associated protein HpnK
MVNEPACAEAVALARENPRLGVGLHLTLLCGRSALPAATIPGLVNSRQEFTDSPMGAGCRYFFRRSLRDQLRQEIRAQFERFHATGLPLDHLNGHLHLHLHPRVFDLLMENAASLGVGHFRLTRDPFWLNLRLAKGNIPYRVLHALIFHNLARRARAKLRRRALKHTDRVFGLLQNARVSEEYITRLIEQLPGGDSELYSHPSLDDFKDEFHALVSPRVRQQIKALGIELIRYQDL